MPSTDQLRALALAATPGPWEVEDDGNEQPCIYADGHNRWIAMFPHQCVQSIKTDAVKDAAYIAALSPQTVLALLDCAEALAALVRVVTGPKLNDEGPSYRAVTCARAALAALEGTK